MNLDSLAKSNQVGSANMAQELLQRISALHEEGYYSVAPDVVSINCVLNAWAKSNDRVAPQKAIDLVLEELAKDRRTENFPNIISLNTIIYLFAKRGMTEQAEKVLRTMNTKYGIQPDTISYNSCIFAYANANNPQKCEELLKEMIELSRDALCTTDVKPDTVTFNTVLTAWSHSNHWSAPNRAESLLRHMERMYRAGNDDIEPDNYSYSRYVSKCRDFVC
jgi:pentatricopeptide repeat protein